MCVYRTTLSHILSCKCILVHQRVNAEPFLSTRPLPLPSHSPSNVYTSMRACQRRAPGVCVYHTTHSHILSLKCKPVRERVDAEPFLSTFPRPIPMHSPSHVYTSTRACHRTALCILSILHFLTPTSFGLPITSV